MKTQEKQNLIYSMMKESKTYWNIKKQILKQIQATGGSVSSENILKIIKSLSFKDQLNNLALNCIDKTVKRIPLEVDPIQQVQDVRLKWCSNVLMSFKTVTSKLKKDDQEEDEDQSVNYVYDCLSFLDYIARIKIPISLRVRQLSIYMFPEEIVGVPSLSQIKVKFQFLNSLDNIGTRQNEGLARQREKKAKKILDNDGFPSDIQHYLLFGSSHGQRMALYSKCLHVQPQQREVLLLQQDVKNNPHAIDKIFTSDLSDLLNDTMYFIFRAEIKSILKMFMRDKSIKDKVKIRPHTFQQSQQFNDIPLSNVIPSQLFAKLIAPFCYCSMKVDLIYPIFRQFYCEYFCLLQSISSTKNSVIYLCSLFEDLLDSSQRKIAIHFSQLNIRPLELVFPWIFYCYIGYIDIQQIFYIFDRIVGMKSLEILPLYAISLLFKQKSSLLQLKSFEQIQSLLHKSMEDDIMQQTIKSYLAYHL